MTNENVKLTFYDTFLARTVLWIFPQSVKPNALTILRMILTPGVVFVVWMEWWHIAIPFFIFTALTDMLDGSLARTRKQITRWGTIADPVADKFLIGSVMIVFVAREINIAFAIIILSMEVCILLAGFFYHARRGSYVSANWAGKIKMALQVIGVTALLLARGFGLSLFVPFSIGTLSVAIVFAIISIYTYSL